MTLMLRAFFLFCLIGAAAGCSDGLVPDGTTRERLSFPTEFAIAPMSDGDTGSAVAMTLTGKVLGEEKVESLPVLSGHTTARADVDGRVFLEALELAMGDVVLSPERFPPNGLELTGISLRLESPALIDAVWSDDDESVTTAGAIDLVLEWAMVLENGDVHALAPVYVREADLEAQVERSGSGELQTTALALASGPVWRWGDYVEASDLVIELIGHTGAVD